MLNGVKRGFFGDQLVLMVFIFALAIVFGVFMYATNTIMGSDNSTLNSYVQNSKNGLLSLNSIAPLLIVGSGLALMASAFFIRTQPVVFAVFLLVQIAEIVVAINFSNVWESVFVSGPLAAVGTQYNLWTLVMKFYPVISVVLGIIFAIFVFAKGGD